MTAPPPPPSGLAPRDARTVPAPREGLVPRLWRTTGHSWAGLCNAWRHERSVRLEAAALVVLLPLAAWLPVARVERLLLVCTMLAVVAVELVNTAIERVVDRISTERHPLSGQAKDIGSSAVAVTLVASGLAWAVVAGPLAWDALRTAFG